jgi:hypothetical protein
MTWLKKELFLPDDLRHLLVTDSIDESIAHFKKYSIEKFGLKHLKRDLKPASWFGELINWKSVNYSAKIYNRYEC